jgi:hypothetical protein
MAVAVEVADPICFADAVERIHTVTCFLSMAAGRAQGVDGIRILTKVGDEGEAVPFSIHASFPPKLGAKSDVHKPHPTDVPFDPIQHRTEFEAALTDWIRRHDRWHLARSRYIDCVRKGNRYNSDRLIAAANMFDVLPEEAAPPTVGISDDLASTRDTSVVAFRKLPASSDRDSALSALGRIGKPSLPKKVAYRIGVLEPKLGSRFPDLQFVASTAVKCRNFLVHGSSGDVDYAKVERLVPFLTDALEFIFSASDFIEAGWDAQRWASNAGGWGHNFSRFRSEYDRALALLRDTLAT